MCHNRRILFFIAKPRLSQARALLCPRFFLYHWAKFLKHGKDTLSSLHYQANSAFPQRIDEIIAEDDLVRLVNGLIDQLDYKFRVLQQNLYYNKELDYFVCPMGQHMEVSALRILRPKAATGYSRVSTRQKTAI